MSEDDLEATLYRITIRISDINLKFISDHEIELRAPTHTSARSKAVVMLQKTNPELFAKTPYYQPIKTEKLIKDEKGNDIFVDLAEANNPKSTTDKASNKKPRKNKKGQ